MAFNHIVKILPEFNMGKIRINAESLEIFTDKILKIILILICMFLAIRIGKYVIRKIVNKQIKSNSVLSLDTQGAKTLGEVCKSILKYAVYFTGAVSIISVIFGKISYTFAGIGGVAVGLGAQSLIKDIISGFFILFENQFKVGDYVVIGKYEGIVKSIGIRTTVIEGFYGDIHSISNGTISSVTKNSSNGASTFYIDIDIAYEEDIDNVMKLLYKVCNEYKNSHEELYDINVAGVENLSMYGVTIRIIVKSELSVRWDLSRRLRKEIKNFLQKNNIKIPYIMDMKSNERIEQNGRKF